MGRSALTHPKAVSPSTIRAVGVRTLAVVAVLTTLVCIVAVAGSEPLRNAAGDQATAPPPVQEEVPLITPDFPVPGALPPEVFVLEPEETAGIPEWLIRAIAAIGLTGLAVAGVVLLRRWRWGSGRRWWRRGERRTVGATSERSPAGAEGDAEVARQAVDEALAPLRTSTDARVAVIEAYARMEDVLADRALARRAPEAPREYLARVMREQGMPEHSLITLTAMYEEARFSGHRIPSSAPRRALAELETMRAALTSRAAPG